MNRYAASVQMSGQKLGSTQGQSFSPLHNLASLVGAHLKRRTTAGLVSQGCKLFLQPALPGVADGSKVNTYLARYFQARLALGQQQHGFHAFTNTPVWIKPLETLKLTFFFDCEGYYF